MTLAKTKTSSDTGILLQGIAGLAIAVLVMLGAGGSVYYLVAAGTMSAIVALSIIGLCAWLSRRWVSAGGRNRHAELFAYGFAAVGAVYAVQIVGRGGL